MYQSLLADSGFYRLLLRFDDDLATATRAMGCWCCGKALHASHYTRKPRGVPPGLNEEHCERFSFCCADRECSKRRTPPSPRFLSLRAYVGAAVVLVSALRCGITPRRLRHLEDLLTNCPGSIRHADHEAWRSVAAGMVCAGSSGTVLVARLRQRWLQIRSKTV
jgi:hypothetical protein